MKNPAGNQCRMKSPVAFGETRGIFPGILVLYGLVYIFVVGSGVPCYLKLMFQVKNS
jgi:hypothetical protein